MKILFIGDVVGEPGRQVTKNFLKKFIPEHEPDLVIANGENAAGGNGLTREVANELFNSGINALSLGNHTWDKKEIINFIDDEERIVRPANYPPGTPGKGYVILETKNGKKVGLLNLLGRVFLSDLDCPFRVGESLINEIKAITDYIIVDFHAEATSEKMALGWFLDGKVSAVIGTHTHIQTNDCRILPKGTAYITDVGMTGPKDSILGIKPDAVIKKFLTQMPVRFEVASGAMQVNGVFLELLANGKAKTIEPITINWQEEES